MISLMRTPNAFRFVGIDRHRTEIHKECKRIAIGHWNKAAIPNTLYSD